MPGQTAIKSKPMKATTQMLKLGVATLLLASSLHPLCAAPPHTGVRVQTFFYQPGFATEVEPGVWVGDGPILFPMSASFSVVAARSGRNVGHFATDASGTLEVSLPPGEYVIVPDKRFGFASPPSPIQVMVRTKCYAEAYVNYQPASVAGVSGLP